MNTAQGCDRAASAAFEVATPSVEAGFFLVGALAHADVWIVHNDWPEWCELTTGKFAGMRRKVVIDGRRILDREKMAGVELVVLGASEPIPVED